MSKYLNYDENTGYPHSHRPVGQSRVTAMGRGLKPKHRAGNRTFTPQQPEMPNLRGGVHCTAEGFVNLSTGFFHPYGSK